MKLNKNFVQISLTALITSAVFVISMAYSGTGLFNAEPVENMRITWQEAKDMQREYIGHRPLRVRIPEVGANPSKRDLEGFSFSVADLEEIIHNNKSDTIPDQVYFQFGQQGKFGDDHFFGILHDSGNMRLIAVGVSKGKRLFTPKSGTEISVFDKADPCPPNCPK